jgi:hypothetical protein
VWLRESSEPDIRIDPPERKFEMSIQIWLVLVSLVIGTGVFVAIRHPIVAANLSTSIAIGLLALWLVASILGLMSPMQQAPERDPAAKDTGMHRLHSISAHAIVIAAWLTFWWSTPISAVRGIRNRALWRTILEVFLALAVVVFALLSSFTGYLNSPGGTPEGYLRFRVLHTIAAPTLGAVATVVFCAVMESARRAVRRAHAKSVRVSFREPAMRG